MLLEPLEFGLELLRNTKYRIIDSIRTPTPIPIPIYIGVF
jgi:hypothetical protein